LSFRASHWLTRYHAARRHRNKIAIPTRIKNKPKAIHRQEPLKSEAPMPADGNGVQVGTSVGDSGIGTVAFAAGETAVLVTRGVREGAVGAGGESLGAGCDVEGEMAVVVAEGGGLPAVTETVGAGDEEGSSVAVAVQVETAVPVGEGTAVSEGTVDG
jgi:hypothetical protein